MQVWACFAVVLCLLAAGGLAFWCSGRCGSQSSIGARAKALMELSAVLEQEDGDEAAAHIAQVAGVSTQEVREWQAAWKAAWRGPA